MARNVDKLTGLAAARARDRGMRNDGAGLYLQIARGGTKSWVLRYKVNGKSRHLGLGPLHTISLAQARERAADARRLLLDGHDPIEVRRASRAAARLHASKTMTFDQCAEAYIVAHRAGWRNPKHAAQWSATLRTYASPVFGSQPVQTVNTGLVMKALESIWTSKPETASRLRGRIEAVLDWAKVHEYYQGENPARWRGHLDHLLPARSKVRRVEHHAALAYRELPTFMADLRHRPALTARALEFLILTACRTSEVLNVQWGEVDLAAGVWSVPHERMKGGREHRVPLSDRALAILKEMKAIRQGDHVFPGMKRGKPLSNISLLALLRRMGRGDFTGHGFRSTFRDWAAERTNFPREVCEAALAHQTGSKVEQAYMRSDLFEKRRSLMDEWARFCSEPSDTVKVSPLSRDVK